jgi:hypothetical protein
VTIPGFRTGISPRTINGGYVSRAGGYATAHQAVSAQLQKESGGCALTCSNWGDHTVTCCCGVGEKCVSTLNDCECQSAHRFGQVSVGPIATFGRASRSL